MHAIDQLVATLTQRLAAAGAPVRPPSRNLEDDLDLAGLSVPTGRTLQDIADPGVPLSRRRRELFKRADAAEADEHEAESPRKKRRVGEDKETARSNEHGRRSSYEDISDVVEARLRHKREKRAREAASKKRKRGSDVSAITVPGDDDDEDERDDAGDRKEVGKSAAGNGRLRNGKKRDKRSRDTRTHDSGTATSSTARFSSPRRAADEKESVERYGTAPPAKKRRRRDREQAG